MLKGRGALCVSEARLLLEALEWSGLCPHTDAGTLWRALLYCKMAQAAEVARGTAVLQARDARLAQLHIAAAASPLLRIAEAVSIVYAWASACHAGLTRSAHMPAIALRSVVGVRFPVQSRSMAWLFGNRSKRYSHTSAQP